MKARFQHVPRPPDRFDGRPGGTLKNLVVGALGVLLLSSITARASAADSWLTVASMPTPRSGLAAVATGNKFYAIGGGDAVGIVGTVEAYNPTTDTWASRAPLPSPRANAAAAATGGLVYFMGGFDGYTAGDVFAYDPGLDSWASKAPLPTRRYALQAVALGGKIYAIGGQTWSQSTGFKTLKTVEEYDPASNTWVTRASMLTARQRFGAAAVDGKIYVFGGSPAPGQPYLASTEAYDPASNTWSPRAPMPDARISLGAAGISGKALAIGGRATTGDFEQTTYLYDPLADAWTTGAPLATARAAFGTAVLDGVVLVAGGYNPSALDTTEAYYPEGPPCGNGTVDPGEECDDDSGCCSPTCDFESPGFPCGDGDVCNGDDTCDGAGTCDPGTPLDCEDNNDCTANSCDPVDGCLNAPEPPGFPCGDGDVCNGDETCDGTGTCAPGTPLDCDDGEFCTQDSCDPVHGCLNADEPAITCVNDTWLKGSLKVDERKPGTERLTVSLKEGPALDQTNLGNPLLPDGTAYGLCIYNEAGSLAGSAIVVDRAGPACETKACWRAYKGDPPGGKGYIYKDKDLSEDGIRKLDLLGGDDGKSRVKVQGQNNIAKGQTALPLGIAAGLAGSESATVQVFGTDTQCLSVEFDDVTRNDVNYFNAKRK